MTSMRGVTHARDQSQSNTGSKQNKQYPALVEDFNKKQVAEYLKSYILWRTLTWNEVEQVERKFV